MFHFFFQAEDGIRDYKVTGVQTCALPIYLVQSQTHRDAHEERLRQFDARAMDVQEISVIERLQAEITELEVARCVQSSAEPLQVEIGQALVEELGADAARDEVGKGFGIALLHRRLQSLLTQNFPPDG